MPTVGQRRRSDLGRHLGSALDRPSRLRPTLLGCEVSGTPPIGERDAAERRGATLRSAVSLFQLRTCSP